MRRTPSVLILIAAIVAIVVVGCGGGESSNDTQSSGGSGASSGSASSGEGSGEASGGTVTTSSLSKAQFVKQADALCKRNREERFEATAAYGEENPSQSEEEAITTSLKEVYVPTMETRLAELRQLGAPQGDEGQIEAILQAYERQLDAIEQLKGAAATPTLDRESLRAEALARKYGLTECAEG